jgi:hypothetical protein
LSAAVKQKENRTDLTATGGHGPRAATLGVTAGVSQILAALRKSAESGQFSGLSTVLPLSDKILSTRKFDIPLVDLLCKINRCGRVHRGGVRE